VICVRKLETGGALATFPTSGNAADNFNPLTRYIRCGTREILKYFHPIKKKKRFDTQKKRKFFTSVGKPKTTVRFVSAKKSVIIHLSQNNADQRIHVSCRLACKSGTRQQAGGCGIANSLELKAGNKGITCRLPIVAQARNDGLPPVWLAVGHSLCNEVLKFYDNRRYGILL